MLYGTLSLVIFILDIIAIIDVVKSGMDAAMKLVWILVILFLPVIGMILWFVIGKKSGV